MAQTPEERRASQREAYRRNFERDRARRNANCKRWADANRVKARAATNRWYAENKERLSEEWAALPAETRRAKRLKNTYGLTLEAYDMLFISQGSRCANPNCLRTDPGGRGWHVDHRHHDGAIRGVLCGGCNVSIGMACDSPAVLRGLAAYLEETPLPVNP